MKKQTVSTEVYITVLKNQLFFEEVELRNSKRAVEKARAKIKALKKELSLWKKK